MEAEKTTSETPKEERNWLGWISAGVTASLIACGSMYLFGYWHYFRINFLEYITVEEVIARSIFDVVPVILVMGEFAVLYLILEKSKRFQRWSERSKAKAMSKLKPGDWRLNPAKRALGLLIGTLAFAMGVGIVVGVSFADPYAGVIIAMPFVGAVIGAFASEVYFPKIGLEKGWSLGLIVLMIPMVCYVRGNILAEKRAFEKMPGELKHFLLTDVDEEIRLLAEEHIYVGRMGGFMFLTHRSKQSTLVIPESRLKVLNVYKQKPKDSPN